MKPQQMYWGHVPGSSRLHMFVNGLSVCGHHGVSTGETVTAIGAVATHQSGLVAPCVTCRRRFVAGVRQTSTRQEGPQIGR